VTYAPGIDLPILFGALVPPFFSFPGAPSYHHKIWAKHVQGRIGGADNTVIATGTFSIKM
jgi:hypothetical protein